MKATLVTCILLALVAGSLATAASNFSPVKECCAVANTGWEATGGDRDA